MAKAMRVMDLPGWPPQAGDAYLPGDDFPISSDEVTIERVWVYANEHLSFACKFEGKSVFYDFPLLDEKTANKVGAILSEHKDKSLSSVAYVEIPEDE